MDELGAIRHYAVIEHSGRPVQGFYEHLGFVELVAEETPERTYIEMLTAGHLSAVHIKKLRNRLGSVLEIISLLDGSAAVPMTWNHFAVTVSDCQETVRSLTDLGGGLVGGPIASPDGPHLVAYVRDASGNLVELVQRVNRHG